MKRTKGYAYGHGKHTYTCTCGKVVGGNGGKSAHQTMHERRGDWRPANRWLTFSEAWDLRETSFQESRPE